MRETTYKIPDGLYNKEEQPVEATRLEGGAVLNLKASNPEIDSSAVGHERQNVARLYEAVQGKELLLDDDKIRLEIGEALNNVRKFPERETVAELPKAA